MKELGAQLLKIWKPVGPLQKNITIVVVLLTVLVLGYVIMRSSAKDIDKTVVNVEEPLVEASSGGSKGFELFDTNTWIKGEKELQVLEMRALKGQLEKDLTEFDQIKSASVILDMASGRRNFGGSQHKTKASVILTLNPQTRLSISQMHAITYHLAGAVHGLEPNMIAISDTTGKLYKTLDPEGGEELLSNASLAFEEHLDQKVQALLTTLIGAQQYSCLVQGRVEKGSQQPLSFSIAVTLDQEHMGIVEEIKNQLTVIASGYEAPFQLAVDVIAFEKKQGLRKEIIEKGGYGGLIVTALVVIAALGSLYPFFRRYSKQKQEDTLFQVMTRVDIATLAKSIEGEDPQTIALMLSYLEPARAEQLIASFSEELQETILNNLSEMEYDSY